MRATPIIGVGFDLHIVRQARSERAQWGGVYRRSAATEVVYRPRARRPRAPHQHGHAARCPRFGHRHGALICAICPRVSPRKSAVKERVGSMSASDPSKFTLSLHDAMVSSILQPRPLPHGQGGVGHISCVRLACAYGIFKTHLRSDRTPHTTI